MLEQPKRIFKISNSEADPKVEKSGVVGGKCRDNIMETVARERRSLDILSVK